MGINWNICESMGIDWKFEKLQVSLFNLNVVEGNKTF